MSAQTQEALLYRGTNGNRVDFTPSGADQGANTVVNLGGGFTGICTSPEGIDDGVMGSVETNLTYKISKDDGAAVSFSRGDTVGWNDTTKLAVAAGTGDWDIGDAEEDSAATDDHVKVALNGSGSPVT